MTGDRDTGPTPSQTVGPFFHVLIPKGSEVLASEQTEGVRIKLVGRVLDGDGEPIDDAMIEIWQPDGRGVFSHPRDPNASGTDADFEGFGRSDTVDGRFEFDTVMPGVAQAASARAPFINVRVFARGLLRDLVTRIYFSDVIHEGDPVLDSVDPLRRSTLIAHRTETPGVPTYHFDVRLQGGDETVFFDVGVT